MVGLPEVYALQVEHYFTFGTFGEDDLVRAEPFAELALELTALWPTALAA